MSHDDTDDQDDKPLDPVLEKVRRKMVRLQLVSAAIMFVSLMAVLGAVVYKVKSGSGAQKPASTAAATGLAVPSDQPLALAARLPAGFKISSTALSGTQVLFSGTTAEGAPRAFVFDLTVGRIIADIAISQ